MKVKEDAIAWHEGFYAGLMLDLREYVEILSFESEYQLSHKSLVMDYLIIRKDGNTVIESPLAAHFCKYNIVEYKSPERRLTIDSFIKTIGYACIYKGLGDTVDVIPLSEMSITVFQDAYPRKVMRELTGMGARVREERKGVYRIEGIFAVNPRIVVVSQIESAHMWIQLLNSGVKSEDLAKMAESAVSLTLPGDIEKISAVMDVVMRANHSLSEEGLDMGPFTEMLMEREKKGEARGEARGEVRGEAKNRRSAVVRMLSMGRTPEAISDFTGEDLAYVRDVQRDVIAVRNEG